MEATLIRSVGVGLGPQGVLAEGRWERAGLRRGRAAESNEDRELEGDRLDPSKRGGQLQDISGQSSRHPVGPHEEDSSKKGRGTGPGRGWSVIQTLERAGRTKLHPLSRQSSCKY